MKYIGLDAGSVSVKLVVFDENGKRLQSSYQRHRGQSLGVALEALRSVARRKDGGGLRYGLSDFSLSLTGSAGRLIGTVLGIEPVNEVVAYAYATRRLFPHIRSIIELGGEDSKLIIMDESSHSAKDFAMNSVCAAGTGSFLDQQAERLRLSIEEFSALCLKSKNPPRIAAGRGHSRGPLLRRCKKLQGVYRQGERDTISCVFSGWCSRKRRYDQGI
jgi:activator of 2-hydroxyglutaryl-CoA dehydratase